MTRDGGRMVVIGIAPGAATAAIEITRLVRRSIQLWVRMAAGCVPICRMSWRWRRVGR